jgi:magnesium transporter
VFRVLDIDAQGTLRHVEGPELVNRPPEGSFRWIDLLGPESDDEVKLLGERFGFHHLALEDLRHRDQRPKVEEYTEYLFIVTQSFECPHARLEDLRWHELHAFLGRNFLVTSHDGEIPGLAQVRQRVEGDAELLKRGAAFVYYLLLDRTVDDNFPILDQIADALEEIEEAVLTDPDAADLARIFALKNQLVLMRKVLSPQRDVMGLLARRGDARIPEQTTVYFRDIYDHLMRIVESIETNRDLLGNALDVYLSAIGQRTNEIMKALALLSAIFLPLTFITGFFGQNFDELPFHSHTIMLGMLGSCIIVPVALLVWFKRSRWF